MLHEIFDSGTTKANSVLKWVVLFLAGFVFITRGDVGCERLSATSAAGDTAAASTNSVNPACYDWALDRSMLGLRRFDLTAMLLLLDCCDGFAVSLLWIKHLRQPLFELNERILALLDVTTRGFQVVLLFAGIFVFMRFGETTGGSHGLSLGINRNLQRILRLGRVPC